MILVIQDVAVIHPLSCKVSKAKNYPNCRVLRNIYRVLPASERLGLPVAIDYLELKAVQVKRVVHSNDILDLPDLDIAELSCFIDSIHVVKLSVDEALL